MTLTNPGGPSAAPWPELPLPAKPLLYIASPMTHPDPAVALARQEAAAAYAAGLINEGVLAYAPVAYTHLLTDLGANPPDWYQFDLHFLARADELRLLTLPGWRESYGVRLERHFARERRIPETFAAPWRELLADRLPPEKLLLLETGEPE